MFSVISSEPNFFEDVPVTDFSSINYKFSSSKKTSLRVNDCDITNTQTYLDIAGLAFELII